MLEEKIQTQSLNSLILGFESSGKSTLFTKLAGRSIGKEINVKGSTIHNESTYFVNGNLIDTPGINNANSLIQTKLYEDIYSASTIILVVRGTHFAEELEKLFPYIEKATKRILLFVTFSDKMSPEGKSLLLKQITRKKLPIFIVDTRKVEKNTVNLFKECLKENDTINQSQLKELINLPISKVDPPTLFFEKSYFGKSFVALLSLVAMFLFPVIVAYQFSNLLQPLIEKYILSQLTLFFTSAPSIIKEIFVGNYGLLTLGIYSFIWAFPVVLMISCSKAMTEESGIKDRIVDTLEPMLYKIGLTGRDILPIITGFGCNVVAVFQSRGCHTCNRSQCISFISFGSACSYQIGATLSIFNSAHAVWLFFPYIFLLLTGSIIHNYLWFKKQSFPPSTITRKAFIQKPKLKTIKLQVSSDLAQFFKQAMPIFLLICITASLLQYMNIISFIALLFHPLLQLFHLPVEGAATLAFSIIRKDGILILNEGNGALFSILTNFQLFLLVFLASTLTSCVVTLATIWKELGFIQAFKLIGQQSLTAILLGLCLVAGNHIIHFI
ncbi:nucleoside recognition domain-containing protein [Niallia sp. Man26]|uniref:nucleoside recognition domain-containing protein n=1 Tax=Niallia TaxID=2837506 RepID=UPI001EDBC2E1|nr:nucleoside recognition domain-containing protein [Niallia sp. Man26]UPO90086.1 50S ribosome-binding GTPase [Niallia sp. Man26]